MPETIIKVRQLPVVTTLADPGLDTTIPTEKAVRDALDLVGGGDASVITYTPAVNADWDGNADPGNADDAFDQLAERVKDIEGITFTIDYKGVINCAGDPNFPAADAGDLYLVSVDGKIGGGSGVSVYEGTFLFCWVNGSPGGNQATVGSDWYFIHGDLTPAWGAGVDASVVTFTPAVNNDWDGNADPGNTDDALDQLAERVDDLEALPGGGIAEAPIDGTPYQRQDAAWVSPGGTPAAPTFVQLKYDGTASAGMTLDSTPGAGHSLILALDMYDTGTASAVASTDTTWTKVLAFVSAGGAYYEIWVGVCGATPGDTITITHPNTFCSAQCIEISNALDPTIGVDNAADVGSSLTLTGATLGNLIAVMAGNDNTTLTSVLNPAPPPGHLVVPDSARGISSSIVPLFVIFATADDLTALVSNASALLMVELS